MTKQIETIRQTLSRASIKRGLASAALMTLAPFLMQASCLPSVPAGWQVPFTMISLDNKNQQASYIRGSMQWQSNFPVDTLSGTNSQLFSDRLATPAGCDGFTCQDSQPFNVDKPDSLDVTVTQNVLTSSLSITLHDLTTKGQATFPAACDPHSGLLYGSLDGAVMAVISFGAPQQPITFK